MALKATTGGKQQIHLASSLIHSPKEKKNNSQQKKNGPRVQRYPLMNGDIKAFTSLKNARANLHWGAKYPKMVSSDFFFIWLLVLSAKIQIHYLKRIFLATVTTKFYYLPFAFCDWL